MDSFGAAKVAKLSDPALGHDGFAYRNGHASPEAMLQKLSGASKAAARRQVAVGTMMAEAEAAHDLELEAAEHPETNSSLQRPLIGCGTPPLVTP